MSMDEYSKAAEHSRPYIYHLDKGNGSVYVLGIEHTRDESYPQIDSINRIWKQFNPDVAFVEGRLGFLISVIQNPVEKYGEQGATARLAKADGKSLYTWEPDKETEVAILLKKFKPEQIALFYSLRPYFSNFRFGKPADPDAKLQEYIQSRTDYNGIRGKISKVAQVDSIWRKDFAGLKDWRETSDEYGWPKGYLSDIFNASNKVRDIHMCSAIIEAVSQGKKVFMTMGSSHAFRIENTLRNELK